MTHYDRYAWGARPPRVRTRFVAPVEKTEIFLHHTVGLHLQDTDVCQWIRNIQDLHMDHNEWNDIGYTVGLDQFGNTYEMRGWLSEGAHTRGHNYQSDAIVYLGDGNEPVSEDALSTVRNLFDEADFRSGTTRARYLHNETHDTPCPGTVLSRWFQAGMPL